MHDASADTQHDLPAALRGDLERAGYYPDLVFDVLDVGVGGEQVVSHLVHAETTFDADEVRRHVTAMVLTPTRLVVAHADDHAPDEPEAQSGALGAGPAVGAAGEATSFATAATEAVPIAQVRSVVVNHVVPTPETYRRGQGSRDLTLTIGWGAVGRIELEPAGCGDPDCEADHGYTGTTTADDVSLRVSADADGEQAVTGMLAFARALSAATAGRADAGQRAARR
ncbi:DUF5998 family protein [Angustibacter aerolatus]|nr:DUF5998 family protein [Angustibacter aerolatus]